MENNNIVAYDLANDLINSEPVGSKKYILAQEFLAYQDEFEELNGDDDNPFNPNVAEYMRKEEEFIDAIQSIKENKLILTLNQFKFINENNDALIAKWKRIYNNKYFAQYVIKTQDPFGNKHRYTINFLYKESLKYDEIYISESLIGKWEGSGTNFAVSNMQNKPSKLFKDFSQEPMWLEPATFEKNIINNFDSSDKVEKYISKILKELLDEPFIKCLKEWMQSGVEKMIGEPEFKLL